MLSESEKLIVDPESGLNPSANLELFGQEYNAESYAICGSDLMIKGEDVTNIVFGDTLGTGRPKEGTVDGDGHPGQRFHYMLANPPFGVEWKPEKKHVTKEHDEFGFNGRFGPGLPRINDGALLFLLHMISKMRPVDFAWKMDKSLGDKRKRKRIGDGERGAADQIAMLTRLYAEFGHDVRMTLGEIGSNVDPSRNLTKSRFVSKVFDNQDFGYLKITVERKRAVAAGRHLAAAARLQGQGKKQDRQIRRQRVAGARSRSLRTLSRKGSVAVS